MSKTTSYQCDGQLEITDLLKAKIVGKTVMDLTDWINNQGKSQYKQIEDVIKKAHEDYKDDPDYIDRMTNCVSIYVLRQSREYMDYLRKESKI